MAGTQAAATSGAAGQDELTIMRLGEMWKTQNDDGTSVGPLRLLNTDFD